MRAFCRRCNQPMTDGLITWKSRIFECKKCGADIRIDFNPQSSTPLPISTRSET